MSSKLVPVGKIPLEEYYITKSDSEFTSFYDARKVFENDFVSVFIEKNAVDCSEDCGVCRFERDDVEGTGQKVFRREGEVDHAFDVLDDPFLCKPEWMRDVDRRHCCDFAVHKKDVVVVCVCINGVE